jgi:3D (Asp-Asp-Asp) domain-containing protein
MRAAVFAILLMLMLFVAASARSAEAFALPAAARPRGPSHRGSLRMTATAYCDRGPTKSGVRAQPGVVAADLRRLPIGTRVRIVAPGESYAGVYTVLDSGSAIRGRDLDIFMPSCRSARRFGKRPVQVRILTTGKNRGLRGFF